MALSVRLIIVILILSASAACIAALFWKQELKYSLPTPVPVDYQTVATGTSVQLPYSFSKGRAYFLHFYNPECPCSRFNAKHIKSLIRNYNDSIQIVVMVLLESDVEKAKSELGENLIVKVDQGGRLAKACGIYSTPQAAIIDYQGNLFYRGNYNRSRYCTTRASNFAELSLIALLNRQPAPSFGLLATQSYGCELGDERSDFELF